MSSRLIATLPEKKSLYRQQLTEMDLLQRLSSVGLAVLDEELRFLHVNEALADFYEISREELMCRAADEMMPELRERVAWSRKSSGNGKSTVCPRFEVTIKNARTPVRVRHFLAQIIRLKNAEKNGANTGLSMVEITEQKQAEESLRRSETRYRDVIEHSVLGFCIVSSEGSVTAANAAMLRILGCSTQEEVGSLNLMRDVFRYSDQQAQLFSACRQAGSLQNAEAEWRRRDGGLLAMRLHLRQLSGSSEERDEVEIIAEDVTELRGLERQLHQAQKFEAIGQLAGGIAHDFNNVIGAILGWAELGYEQNRANEKTAERFMRIREQGERAAALTRELLAFARKQVLQPRAVDLNAVISGLVSFLDRVIGKDIALEVQDSPLDAIKADPTQVEQVLMNLCINARDAMPNGGRLLIESGMVEVDESYTRFYPGVISGRYAVLSVSDSGCGMDTKTLEHIFEPFFTTKETGKGTGLGLSTVYGIVKQHGGFLHVYSEPAQGSLFRIYFPAMPGSF